MEPDTLVAEGFDAARPAGRSFEDLLVGCRPRLYRVALLMLGSPADAEDLCQRALLRAWQGRRRFRGGSAVYTWLYRILVNLGKDLFRSRARAERWLEDFAREEPEAEPGAERRLAEREREEQVRRAMAALDLGTREVLVLRHYEEMSYGEIAEALGCPVGTVRSRLHAARARLRDEVVKLEGSGGREGGAGADEGGGRDAP